MRVFLNRWFSLHFLSLDEVLEGLWMDHGCFLESMVLTPFFLSLDKVLERIWMDNACFLESVIVTLFFCRSS